MANITDFKVSGDDRTVTKVRVSMDDGKTWGVLYTKEESYYYKIEQDGVANIHFQPDNDEYDEDDTYIYYIVKKYDRKTDEFIEEFDSGDVESNLYCYRDVIDNLGYEYDEEDYLITTVHETHYIDIDGVEHEFKATINLYNDDYVDMTTCPECGCRYPYSGDCPNCAGGSQDDEITIDSYDVYFDEGDATISGDGDYEVTFNMSDGDTYTKWIRESDTTKYNDGTIRADVTFTYGGETFNVEVILN